MKVTLLIPAYRPTIRLIELINSINFSENFSALVINNGNLPKFLNIFEELKENKFVEVISVDKNLGKGYGLKKGIIHCNKSKKSTKIIFADADGQHTKEDILKMKNHLILEKNKSKFIIGKRKHNFKTPLLNLLGNKLYSFIFNLIFNTSVDDPLSGLRGMDIKLACQLLNINSNEFEFEVETIMLFKKNETKVCNVSVSSTYFKDNISNFNKVVDSFKILKKTIKFLN